MKLDPREGSKRLRHAVKEAAAFPALSANHVGGGDWAWPEGSPQLDEAKRVLETPLPDKRLPSS